ncbi:MAG: molybdate ABC transporter substrate-binding protein [Treponema sp.]|nr:molybdate ABC transporter substrate-binding protein [Treponema sp.]
MKRTISCILLILLFCAGVVFAESPSLLVYCGAGLKKPMEELKSQYEKAEGGQITYTYAGSGQLISQIQLSGKGDVLIIGSEDVYKTAVDKKLAYAPVLIAHHTPCIAVLKGNPKGIKSLADMAKPGVRVILGDPKANAVGLSAQNMITKNKLPGINTNTVAQTSTVNELVVQLTMGQADAAIVTKDSVASSDKLEIIEIPAEQNIDQLIPVGILTVTRQKDAAQKFVDFTASAAGKACFKKFGFDPVE